MTARGHIFLRALFVVCLALVQTGGASWASPTGGAAKVARRWATHNGAKTRSITVGAGARQLKRVFVSVTPEKYNSFVRQFSEDQGFLHLFCTERNWAGLRHPHLALGRKGPLANGEPGDCYLWGQDVARSYRSCYAKHQVGGYVVPLEVSKTQGGHLSEWISKLEATGRYRPGQGNCMQWLANAELAPNQGLFHRLGVKRSKDGPNMKAKILHAANERIEVVGVCVADNAQFEAMSPDQLAGRPPKGGILDAMRLSPAEAARAGDTNDLTPTEAGTKQRSKKKRRFVKARKAARLIGRGVYVAMGSAMPTELLYEMRKHAMRRDGRTDVYYMSTFASANNFSPEVTEKFHPNLFFVSMSNREAASKGRATIHRDSLFNLSERIVSGEFNIDTVVVRVSPPDKNGMVSLGVTGDLTLPAIQAVVKRGGTLIAEMNPNVPNVSGNKLRLNRFAAVYRSKEVLPELTVNAPTTREQAIADHIARLIPRRKTSTLQVGIGGALVGLGEALKGKKFRIWSEMGSDWVKTLMEGDQPSSKSAVLSFLHGSADLYRFADGNANIRVTTQQRVNDPARISKLANMVAINTGLEVDLLGNVNAERIGSKLISSPGGQPDFMKGAAENPEGKAIMALRSISKLGTSTIALDLQGPVTTRAQHVDHVVTEWGATRRLRKLPSRLRVYEIIGVSHPIHRLELAQAAQKKGYIDSAQVEKLRRSVFHSLRQSPAELRQEVLEQISGKSILKESELKALAALE